MSARAELRDTQCQPGQNFWTWSVSQGRILGHVVSAREELRDTQSQPGQNSGHVVSAKAELWNTQSQRGKSLGTHSVSEGSAQGHTESAWAELLVM